MKNKYSLFILALCAAFALTSCGGGSKTEKPKKIEVTGSAEMEIVPNEIYMNFTLKEYLDPAKKKVKLETVKADFLKLCKTEGVADSNISISGYSGNERWDYYWYKRWKSDPDFMGTISYSIKVSSPEKLDRIVSGLNENAIDNFHISKTSHSDIEKLRKEVKTNALKASKAKAEYLAASVGEEIGDALLIQEIEGGYRGGYGLYSNESNVSNKVSQMSSSFGGDDDASSPNFEKMKLRYEMKVEYRLK